MRWEKNDVRTSDHFTGSISEVQHPPAKNHKPHDRFGEYSLVAWGCFPCGARGGEERAKPRIAFAEVVEAVNQAFCIGPQTSAQHTANHLAFAAAD